MKDKIFIIIVILSVTLSGKISAQDDAQFSHIMFSEMTINPAAISNANKVNLTAFGRMQWYGLEGRPNTAVLNGATYLQKIYGGVGLSMVYDQIGYEKVINLKGMYAYPIQLDNMMLNLGLGFGFINTSIDGTKLIYADENDPMAFTDKHSKFKADFSFGAELNGKDYSVGLSSSHLDKGIKGASEVMPPRHYFLYGKYKIRTDEDIDIVPYLLIKSTLFATSFELNTNAHFYETFWGGLTYRHQDALVLLAGYIIDKEYRIGYAYDFGISKTRTTHSGSHEILLSASLDGFNKTRVKPKTPRLF